jgi:hypothetical protein
VADSKSRGSGWLLLATGTVLQVLPLTLLSGCSSGGSLELDVSAPSAGTRGATLDLVGGLQGSVTKGKACFWVTASDGSTVSLVWPAGSTARVDPLRVEDSTGRVLATVGDANLLFEGTPGTDEEGCHPGSTVFFAGGVSSR